VNGQPRTLGGFNHIDADPFHRRSRSKWVSAGIGKPVRDALFTKNALPSRKARRKAHAALERSCLDAFDDLEQLELMRAMPFQILLQDIPFNPAWTLVP